MEGQVPSLQRGEVYDLYCTDPETRDIAGVTIRYVHIDYFPDYWDIRTAGGGAAGCAKRLSRRSTRS